MGSSQTRDWTCVSCIGKWFFTSKPPGKPSNILLKEFGEYFLKSCKRSDFDHMLMTPAGNFYNFMETWMHYIVTCSCHSRQEIHVLRALKLPQKVTKELKPVHPDIIRYYTSRFLLDKSHLHFVDLCSRFYLVGILVGVYIFPTVLTVFIDWHVMMSLRGIHIQECVTAPQLRASKPVPRYLSMVCGLWWGTAFLTNKRFLYGKSLISLSTSLVLLSLSVCFPEDPVPP